MIFCNLGEHLEAYGREIGDPEYCKRVAFNVMERAGYKGQTTEPSAGFGAVIDRFKVNLLIQGPDGGEPILNQVGRVIPIDMRPEQIKAEARQFLTQYKQDYFRWLKGSKN